MTVDARRDDGIVTIRIRVADTLDASCADGVKRAALAELDPHHDVVVDLRDIEFVDSAGLGVMVSLFKAARRYRRRAVFVGARPGVMRVMRIIQLDRIFEVDEDEAAARARLAGAPVGAG